jgi:energy-coupling factor transporter ATP-binding protein EcfA2
MSRGHISPGIFESINARFLRPEEVAQSFVLCDHFRNLSVRGHSLAVGPRGSGKTTLLKMLQGPALSAWKHPEADSYKMKIDYTGVFIPTDIVWAKQIKNLGEGYLSTDQHKLVERAIFTTHILHELIQAMHYRLIMPNDTRKNVHGGVNSSDDQEADLVASLSANWGIDTPIHSLISLKQSLLNRMGNIYEMVSKERFLSINDRNDRFASIPYLHINFLQATISAIEIFGDIYKDTEHRWALLFDELELAPKDIVQHLITSLRSTDQRIFFKLSFSPYNENVEIFENAWAAMPKHDFQYIKLWYPYKEDGTEFSKALVASMLNDKDIQVRNLNEIFGPSFYDEDRRKKNKYDKESSHVKLFKRMFREDRSFKYYVIDNKIDLDKLDELNENERAGFARKIYPIAAVRDAFRKPDKWTGNKINSDETKRKSRKAYPVIYAGSKSLLDMLEGNPRWIIGVVGPLLDIYKRTKKQVPKSKQMEEIKKATNQFKSLLSAMPCEVSPKGAPPKSVMSILEMIGEFFRKVIVEDKFKPEPYGSFIVDQSTTAEFERALALALNAGAIVFIPGSTTNIIIKSLKDRRFRLTYLLAPNFQIPIQLMRATSLKRILSSGSNTPNTQLLLFEDIHD